MALRAKIFQLDNEQLEKILENPLAFFDIDPNDENHKSIDIDKSWDGIKFLLSNGDYDKEQNTLDDLSRIIFSGQAIENFEEYDIYEVHYLTSEQVKQTIKELNEITEQTLRDNFRPEIMNKEEVYNGLYDNSAFEYLFENLIKVKDLYINAEKSNKAVITYLS